jgi:protocatechuate 3,4-dioxygenase beta subunit
VIRVAVVVALVACTGKPRNEPAPAPPTAPAASTATPASPAASASAAGSATATALRAGMPLDLRVRLVRANGEPARNIAARVFHTDAEGYYLKNPDGSEAGGEHARLSFVVRTDADGRFTLRTILPAPYPSGGPPAHVHLNVPPEHRDSDLTIMLDSDPKLDRERIARMARTSIGRVRLEGDVAICEATLTAP